MTAYLIRTLVCGGILYALYRFLLANEKTFVLNRFFLLSALLGTFFIPLLTVPLPFANPWEVASSGEMIKDTVPFLAKNTTETSFSVWEMFFFIGYFSVAGCFLFRFLKNMYVLFRRISVSEKEKQGIATFVFLSEKQLPYSFFNYVFIYKSDKYDEKILIHELSHVRQKHSVDILLAEIVKAVCWFHPAVYLFGKAIRTNHEFLADDAVVRKTADSTDYQQLLLYKNSPEPYVLTSNFGYLTTKKRIIMLQRTPNPAISRLKKACLIPLVLLTILFVCEKNYAQDTKSQKETKSSASSIAVKIKGIRGADGREVIATLVDENGNEFTEDISTKEKRKAFEEKYGIKLPPPPPPPPILEKQQNQASSIAVKIKGIRGADGREVIATLVDENGNEFTEDISTKEKRKAFEEKYGIKLPPPPPPPPSR
ncbi:MAG: M56 family metallopeptidase [Capnocytophaga sp.]|nr:M56 family metallopeptidase [Capnocytophaga sp.]